MMIIFKTILKNIHSVTICSLFFKRKTFFVPHWNKHIYALFDTVNSTELYYSHLGINSDML